MAEYSRQNLVEYYSWQNTAEYGKIWQRYKYKRRTASIYGSYEPDNYCNQYAHDTNYKLDNNSINTPAITTQPIDKLYVQPLLPPDARTVLLPKSNNCCTDTPAIPIIVILISLQPIKKELPEDRQEFVPIRLRNRPCTGTALPHTIDKPIAPLCLLLRY